ncbi:MAG: Bug family tripartite tricarboxylate transporter substrate binding protein, partial [Burkholderiales bacterium]
MSPAGCTVRAACAFVVFAVSLPVLAQGDAGGYPSRPVRIVVPFGPGSGPDVRTRQLGQKLAADWGQPVVVENRPGAGGQLALEQVAHAMPDGYTLVMAGQSPLAIAPHLAKLRFDPLKDFAPVTRTSKGAIVLTLNAQLPVRSVPELIGYASRNPSRLNAASWGPATVTHLALELFMRAAGIRITHVPYKSAAQAINEVAAGQVQLAFDFYPAIGAQLKAGRLRAIAVSGGERMPALPEVPTFTEVGVAEMATVSGWQGVALPAGTRGDIVQKLYGAVVRALALPDMRASYTESGFET